MVALINNGSTHNFISDGTMNQLNLKITPTKPFNVHVADGSFLQCIEKLEGSDGVGKHYLHYQLVSPTTD